jgi:Sec-independent protein translocase protein TatA
MVGPSELLLILIVVLFILLIWRGPQMLPQLGEALGKAVKGVRQTVNDDAPPDDADATATKPRAADDASSGEDGDAKPGG